MTVTVMKTLVTTMKVQTAQEEDLQHLRVQEDHIKGELMLPASLNMHTLTQGVLVMHYRLALCATNHIHRWDAKIHS